MEWIYSLIGNDHITSFLLLIALTIAIGLQLGKLKIANISLGITWILFVGIAFSSLGISVNSLLLHYTKELGLILFVYAIGLQVGTGFFSSFRKGGIRLNLLASTIVLLGVMVTYVIHVVTNTDLVVMTGILSGAVTNTPGLGAAQQSYFDLTGEETALLSQSYAVSYPCGVIGIIISMLFIKYIFRIKTVQEEENTEVVPEKNGTTQITAEILNPNLVGHTVKELRRYILEPMIISRIKHADNRIESATGDMVLALNDKLRIVTYESTIQKIELFAGKITNVKQQEWETDSEAMVSRKILVTKSELNGERIDNLHIRTLYHVSITRINRAGIELIASNDFQLQMGDRLTVVGNPENIEKVASLMGNSLRRLYQPNLIPIFFGIFLGIVIGSFPFSFSWLPQPIKLGLAGGPLIVAILMARFGPYYRIVTYSTTSANMMIREIGISLFLAAVGLGTGNGFFSTIMNGGYLWVLYGILITLIPVLVVGIFARIYFKINFFTLTGLLAGSTTNPPALAFANEHSTNDLPAVAYATVYPLTMFLRVLTAQLLIILSYAS